MASQIAQMAALMQNMKLPADVMPKVVNLPAPPEFVGPLAPNEWLAKAQKFANNLVLGPESMVVVGGYVYTGLQNGWVVEIQPSGTVRKIIRMSTTACGGARTDEATCGRPLGIRVDSREYLIVADAYKGIFKVNAVNGRYTQLVDATKPVNGKPLGYINDLAVANDGTIFFTSSSSKYPRSSYFNIILEGETSGRVLVYNPHAAPGNRVQELVVRLNFPNGLELSKDESYLLIAEGARTRIYRAWIGANSPKRYTIETFASNLPGFVDNIRRSPRNTYWVGFSSTRSKDAPSVLDRYGTQPQMRRTIMQMPKEQVVAQLSKHGLVVELNEDGQIVRSLHDPSGTLFPSVSEVEEENGILYLGSIDRPFVGRLSLAMLPPPVQPGTGTGTSSTASPGRSPSTSSGTSTSSPGKSGPATTAATGGEGSAGGGLLDRFLNNVRLNMSRMSPDQLRDAVVVLLRRLLWTMAELQRVAERARRLQHDLQNLKGMLPRCLAQGGAPVSGAQPSATASGTTCVGGVAQQAPSGTTPSGGRQQPGTTPSGGRQQPGTTPPGGRQQLGTTPSGGRQQPHTTLSGGRQQPGTPSGGRQQPGTPSGGRQQPGTTPSGGRRQPGTTPSGGRRQPGTTPSGGRQQPDTTPSGGRQQPGTTPSGGRQQPDTTPSGGRQQPDTTPSGVRQQPDTTPSGVRQQSDTTPSGVRQQPDTTPSGVRQQSDTTPSGGRQQPGTTPSGVRQQPDTTPSGARQQSDTTPSGGRQQPGTTTSGG